MNIKNMLNLSMGSKLTGFTAGIIGIFAPIHAMLVVITLFITVDFFLGLTVSMRVKKEPFCTQKAYWSVWKLIGAMICILLAYIADIYIFTFLSDHYLANFVASFVCGIEFWSILSYLSVLSDNPIFMLIRKLSKIEVEKKTGIDLSDLDNIN